jgi:D-inositol-3-phosphate glycosyltransferase
MKAPSPAFPLRVSLLTGCMEPHYQLGLLSGLAPTGITIEAIGGDSMEGEEVFNAENIRLFNLRGSQDREAPPLEKVARILKYYLRLICYAISTESRVFHIQWFNKFILFDRTILNIYYKMLGKRLIHTAHNIDAQKRDNGASSFVNRVSLQLMYMAMDNIIVHTNKMKMELTKQFGIDSKKITVIPHGINSAVPKTDLTKSEARRSLGLDANDKVLLLFGNINPYKGIEYALLALDILKKKYSGLKLIIAGLIDSESYWSEIERVIDSKGLKKDLLEELRFIPDEEIEVFFKAADLMVLPYRDIFQSGVLFLSFSFGLPVVATDVGSLKEAVMDSGAGAVCRPYDPEDLSEKIDLYFQSELYRNQEDSRKKIIDYAMEKYSWKTIGMMTRDVYQKVMEK